MNKFLITLATLVAFSLNSVAFADAKISGFMQRIIGMGDDVDGGVSEQFTRFALGADTTTDNGWVVGGSMSIQTAATTGGSYLPSSNHMYVQTDMMTVNIGHTADALTSLIPAVSAMVPGGGNDAGYQYLFDAGNLGHMTVSAREFYYAGNAAKIDVDLPAINGFTVGMSYTPSMEFKGTSPGGRAQAETTADHGETLHVAAQYSGELEGMSYTLGAGVISGNSQSEQNRSGTQALNNDLAAFSVGLKVTMGNMTIGVAGYDNGESWGASTDAVKAQSSGYNLAVTWAMGNMTVGAGFGHQELVRGTRAQATATKLTSANAGNVREDNTTMIGVGYDMGGGVSTFVQLSNNDHSDGDHATTEVDPQVLFGGISLGF